MTLLLDSEKPAALVQIKLEFGCVDFCGGRKNPQSKARTNNNMNLHETTGTRSEPGSQRLEAISYPWPHPCSCALLHTVRK